MIGRGHSPKSWDSHKAFGKADLLMLRQALGE
jgi:hypothetical protein